MRCQKEPDRAGEQVDQPGRAGGAAKPVVAKQADAVVVNQSSAANVPALRTERAARSNERLCAFETKDRIASEADKVAAAAKLRVLQRVRLGERSASLWLAPPQRKFLFGKDRPAASAALGDLAKRNRPSERETGNRARLKSPAQPKPRK